MLTEKEKQVLSEILSGSNFNGDCIDLTKTWNNQRLEDRSKYYAFADVRDYGCGYEKPVVRAIFGSLMKKNLIDVFKDDEEYVR